MSIATLFLIILSSTLSRGLPGQPIKRSAIACISLWILASKISAQRRKSTSKMTSALGNIPLHPLAVRVTALVTPHAAHLRRKLLCVFVLVCLSTSTPKALGLSPRCPRTHVHRKDSAMSLMNLTTFKSPLRGPVNHSLLFHGSRP